MLCARDRVLAQGVFAPPASFLLLMYVGMVVAPITLYLYAAHPSWTWMYMLNPAKVPSFSLIPLVALHCTALIVGWYLGGKLVLAQREKIARNIALAGLVISLVGVVVFWGRLGRVGSFEEFSQGRALALMDVKLGYVLVPLAIASTASAIFVIVELLRDSRRLRSR